MRFACRWLDASRCAPQVYLRQTAPIQLREQIIALETSVERDDEIIDLRRRITQTARVQLNDQLNNIFEFSASISVDGKTIMTNSFQLTNIKSAVLQGA